MKIISFAWTSPALLAGEKSRTRRKWNDKYAAKFKAGDLLQAWDKSPRFKGKPIAIIEVTGIKYEDIQTMPDEDYEREGFRYFEEQGLKIRGQVPRIAFAEWKHEGGFYYVLDFRLVSITPGVQQWNVRSKKTGVVCHISTTAEGAARWSDRFLGEHSEVMKE